MFSKLMTEKRSLLQFFEANNVFRYSNAKNYLICLHDFSNHSVQILRAIRSSPKITSGHSKAKYIFNIITWPVPNEATDLAVC